MPRARAGLPGDRGSPWRTCSPLWTGVRSIGRPWFVPGSTRDSSCRRISARPAGAKLQLGAGEAQVAGDEEALDLGGSLADLEHLRVAVEPRHRELLHEAVSAVDLDGVAGRGDRDLAGVQLGDRGLGLVRPALVTEPRRVVRVHPRRLDGDLHVGQLELQPLERTDRALERLAFARVLHALVEAALGEADAERGDRDAPVVQDLQELREPLAALAEQVLLRH